jgi:hypothetical protein
MKRLQFFLALVITSTSIRFAQGDALTPSTGPTPTLGSLVNSLPMTPSVACLGLNPQILVPVVIRGPGKNGTFYETDLVLTNGLRVAQDILVGFIPEGVQGINQPTQRFTMPRFGLYQLVDFLGPGPGQLNLSGVGSLLIVGVLSGSSSIDPNALIGGEARIWTPQPGSSGTTSFSEATVVPGVVQGSFPDVFVQGARQNSDFRTNLGLVNLFAGAPEDFIVLILGASGENVYENDFLELPALSMSLIAVPAYTLSPGNSSGYLLVDVEQGRGAGGNNFPWYTFTTSADNVTGDAWYSAGYLVPPAFAPDRRTADAEKVGQ